MDAGIRAPGAKNIYLPVSKARQSLFQKILNTNPFVLFLPAEEVSAVVFYVSDYAALATIAPAVDEIVLDSPKASCICQITRSAFKASSPLIRGVASPLTQLMK